MIEEPTNPLVDGVPEETLNRSKYVLDFLGMSQTLAGVEFTNNDDIGLKYILQMVRDAIDYESRRMRQEAGSD